MCQYSTFVTLAICADVQRTGDPSACKRQTIVSAARATALANSDSSALDRHLDIICGAIDERRAEKEPVVAAAPVLGATGGFDGSRKVPGRKGPRALARVRNLAKGAVGRITTSLSLSLPLRTHTTTSPRLLSQTNDSTTLLHRHFERARIEKLGPSPNHSPYFSSSSSSQKQAERRHEVEGQIWSWLETGAFWVKETDGVPRRRGRGRRRVRFVDEFEGEEEWSSVLGHRFGVPGFGRVDSGVEFKV